MVDLREMRLDDVPLLAAWDSDPDVASALGGAASAWYDWSVEIQRAVSWREFLVITEAGRPVGFMQLLDTVEDEAHYWGEVDPSTWSVDIWIGASPDRGRGVGEAAMTVALRRLFVDHDADRVLIDPLVANRRAVAFYDRIGFGTVGERRIGGDDCLVMCMTRDDWHRLQSQPLEPSDGRTTSR